jgi:hypothetical protein
MIFAIIVKKNFMKKLAVFTIGVCCVLSVASCGSDTTKNTSNKVEVKESKQEAELDRTVIWIGKKFGGQHEGTIGVKELSIKQEEGRLVDESYAIIDMNDIVCTDITDAEDNKKLVDHLKNDDFFSSKKYPTSKLVIKATRPASRGYKFIGELTLKDVTTELEGQYIIRKDNEGRDNLTLSFQFDRTAHDITYKSKSIFKDLGDHFIDDMITVETSITLK